MKKFISVLALSLTSFLLAQSTETTITSQSGSWQGAIGTFSSKGYMLAYVNADINYTNGLSYFDSTMNLVWDKTVYINGSNSGNDCYLITQHTDDNYIYQTYMDIQGNNSLIKLNYSGNVEWIKTWPYDSNSYLYPELISTDDNYVYVLWQEMVSGVKHIVMKLDNSGNLVWQRMYASVDPKWPINRFSVDESGNIYLSGSLYHNMYEMKILPNGNLGYSRKYNNPSPSDYGQIQGILPLGNGSSFIYGYRQIVSPPASYIFYAISDGVNPISQVKYFQELGFYDYMQEAELSDQGTILATLYGYDSLSLMLTTTLIELDFSGNIIMSKKQNITDNFNHNIWSYGDMIAMEYSSGIEQRIILSDRDLNSCENFDNVQYTILTGDLSDMNIVSGITESTPNINMIAGTGSTQPYNEIQVNLTCSSGVGVEENQVNTSLYPNPCSDYMVIESAEQINGWRIYSIEGKLVKTSLNGIGSGPININVQDLASGVYMILVMNNGFESVQKFVKE